MLISKACDAYKYKVYMLISKACDLLPINI